jgi:hypothetical protein
MPYDTSVLETTRPRYFLGDSRWLFYAALNVFVGAVLTVGAAMGGSVAELPYLLLLFAICSSPIPFIGPLNGAYAVLAVAMAYHFVEFGLLDAVHLFSAPTNTAAGDGLVSAGELLIMIGALVKVLSFHAAVRFTKGGASGEVSKDWPPRILLALGVCMWLASSALNLYQALYLQIDNSNAALNSAYAKLGPWGTDAVLLITQYMGMMGIMVLAYWWSVWNRRGSTVLMLAIIVVQLIVGWIIDTKEVAVGAPFIILLTRFITLGRVPMRWVIPSLLGIVLVFPVLTAKRIIVTEYLGMTRAEALSHAGEILWRAITEQNEVSRGKYGQKSQSFLERATDKGAVEVFVAHVGQDKPYKMGATLDQLLYVFVPRVVWSDKPGGNSSQTFNRDFHLSEDPDTHISPTFLGELYWNFGYIGAVIGTALLGLIFGYVVKRFDPSIGTSITRVLVIIVTLYETAIGQGGQIELAYVLWIRMLVLIGLMHLVLARPAGARPTLNPVGTDADRGSPGPLPVRPIRFENLLE